MTTETTSSSPSHRRGSGRSRPRVAVLALVAGVALVALACSSSKKSDTATADSSTTTTAASSTTTAAGASGSASVKVATTSLGPVVVDAKGLTLYFYKKDTGTTSTCSGSCATAWPPAVATGTPTAGDGVTATLTTITRDDGTKQLALGGHPLYRFSGDTKAGDVSGQGVGNAWNAAGADGQPVG